MTSGLITPANFIMENNRKNNTEVTSLRFPQDLGPHAMILNFKDYTYGGGSIQNSVTTGSIALPLPKALQDMYSPNIQDAQLGIAGAATADIASALINGPNAGKININDIMQQNGNFGAVASNAAAAMRYFTRAGLGSIAPDVGMGIDAATGTAVNPQQTIIFDGVSLKSFTFEWSFSPKNAAESETLRKIINTIRAASLPAYASPFGAAPNTGTSISRGLLKYPKMVDILLVGVDSSYFIQFKTGMITQLAVDYTPNGVAMYKGESGAKPTFVNITISMKEAAIHTRDDYTGAESSNIVTGGAGGRNGF
jgi:hypothetical protein